MTLYHYTCEHGHRSITRDGGIIRPASSIVQRHRIPALPWTGDLVWLTDMPTPNADALGLTRNYTTCDRTAHRWRILHPDHAIPWTEVRAQLPAWMPDQLEKGDARPAHWWITNQPIAAVYDPA